MGLVTREVAEEEVLLARAPLLARELRRAEDGRRGLGVLRVQRGAQRPPRGVGRAALRVDRRVEAVRRRLEERDDRRVVGVRDGLPRHALRPVGLPLALEDRVQEELLQLLVGEVDAQLGSGLG